MKKEKIITNPYRKKVYSLMTKEKKDIVEDKLRKKGVMVGEGYNVAKLKSVYQKEKEKEKIQKFSKKIVKAVDKLAKQKMESKRIFKKSKMSYTMPNREIENVFNDKNRFFKGAIQNGL